MSPATCRACLVAGGLLGAAAVGAGAFGAHGLKETLAATGHAVTWETATRYALVHALAIVAAGLAARTTGAGCRAGLLAAAAWCFGLGTLVFSGLLAVLAITGIRILGAIVPIGGVLLIAGWLLLAGAAARSRREPAADCGH